jgi:hypothetical protein
VSWALHHGLIYDTNESVQLCYTRGTAIPLSLTLSSTDEQALALLSASTAPVVQLQCTLEYQPLSKQIRKRDRKGKSRADGHADRTVDPTVTALIAKDAGDANGAPQDGMLRMTRVVQCAVWWVDPQAKQDTGQCTLRGELHVSPRLKPELVVPDFKLCVSRRLVSVVYRNADEQLVLRCSPSLSRAGICPLRPAVNNREQRPAPPGRGRRGHSNTARQERDRADRSDAAKL